MAESKCPKCDSTRFEVVHAHNLEGSKRAILFVQCAECGCVIGTLDFVNLGVQASDLKESLHRLADRIRASIDP